ncbi:branched-chain amino acid ABC transporter permease [Nocardioides carbamazepini]|uniref:branched-chain amino acid ABC transporter permease n=1 Tax=Nocardioides carbamazepini TaxID=2854259 RepID=UPI00214A783F|nr:branched-chain amino acid ABC transporter permease [Nocardioides carbamazepini]MCR1781276.1 branched-chain amino acid ABC transporter permease [Nocardioides carbamazepini]
MPTVTDRERTTEPRTERSPVLLAEGSRAYRIVALVIVGAITGLALIGTTLSVYRMSQVTAVMITAIAVVGLNLATGYTGLLSIGHSALFGVGAYATGILILDYAYSPLLTLPVATALGFAVGLIVGVPALRIRGLYFSLVTLALGIAFPEIIRRFDDFTGGAAGLLIRSQFLTPPSWTGLTRFERGLWLYGLSFVSLVVVMLLVRNLMRSRTGIAMRGVRDHEVAIRSNGVDVARTKVITFGLSGAITGYAGGLFAMNVGALSPDGGSFTLVKSIELITAMFIGGAGTLLGPLIGSTVTVFLPELTSTWTTGPISGVLFGVTLIVLVFFMPEGIAGRLQIVIRRFVRVVPSDHPVARRRASSTQNSGGKVTGEEPVAAGGAEHPPGPNSDDASSEGSSR